ncbi:protein of unknown function DUF222 [Frankia sp. QA3]|nr:protein of unknown function DUF222 [Frankia sp. QA3]
MWPLSDAELALAVDDSAAALSRLAAARLQLVREVHGRGMALRAGAESTQAWLRERLRVRPVDARRLLDLAAALDGPLTATGAALAEGRITVDQALVICKAMRSMPAMTSADVIAAAEECLVECAATFDPAELTRIGQRIHKRISQLTAGSDDADPPDADPPDADPPDADAPDVDPPDCAAGDGSDEAVPGASDPAPTAGSHDDAGNAYDRAGGDAEKGPAQNMGASPGSLRNGSDPPAYGTDQDRRAGGITTPDSRDHARTRRGLWLTDLPEGMTRLDGELDAEAAATLRSALAQLTGADTGTDDRLAALRRVDALTEIVRRAQVAAMWTVTGGVATDLADDVPWAVLGPAGSPPPDSGTGGRSIPVLSPKLALRSRSGHVWPHLTAIHTDLGRWRQDAHRHLRQAASAGDRHCVSPGCDRSARWCDGHLLRA